MAGHCVHADPLGKLDLILGQQQPIGVPAIACAAVQLAFEHIFQNWAIVGPELQVRHAIRSLVLEHPQQAVDVGAVAFRQRKGAAR